MNTPNDLHQELIRHRATLCFASAGAGTAFSHALWRTPGSSEYLAGASLLQARSQFDRYIGFHPENPYCSESSALDLATVAYLSAARAATGEEGERQPIGLGLTATVATNRLHRGDQRAFMAVVTPTSVLTRRIVFEKQKGLAARLTQDRLIAEACGTLLRMALEGTEDERATEALMSRLRERPVFHPDGRRDTEIRAERLLFPANFNPPHDGHHLALTQAEAVDGRRAEFALEACPPNKPHLSPMELLRRVALIEGKWGGEEARTVHLTFGEANYLDKARARPGTHFIAGTDAIARLFESGWGYEVEPMLRELRELGSKFFVLSRPLEGRILSLEDLACPDGFEDLFVPLEGVCEASSTAERARQRSA